MSVVDRILSLFCVHCIHARTACICTPDSREAERLRFVEREAEEDVAEPRSRLWYFEEPEVTITDVYEAAQKVSAAASQAADRHSVLDAIEDAYWCSEHGVIRSLCVDMHPRSSAAAPPAADVASLGRRTNPPVPIPTEGSQPNPKPQK